MGSLDVKLSPRKDLRVKIQDAEGKEREVDLKFQAR